MASVEPAGSAVAIVLEDYEADLFRGLLRELRSLLRAKEEGPDPVIDRLFPRAYQTDEDEASYRDIVGGDLREYKLEALTAVELTVGAEGAVNCLVDTSEAELWLTLLTDLRLAIGTRLEVTEEIMDAALDPKDPNAGAIAALHWLGWIQDSLLRALNKTAERGTKKRS